MGEHRSTRIRHLGLALLAVGILGGAPLRAQTTVPGGTISVDTTWTLAGSPYTVTGSVSIAGTDGGDGITTLTIAPGVVVRFNAATQLQIGGATAGSPGALIADGNAAGGPAQILFTSSSPTPGPGGWAGLYFRAGARSSTLRNARVEYGGGSGWAGIQVATAASTVLTLDAIEVANSANNGIDLAGAVTLALSGSTIESSALDDLYVGNNSQITGSVTGCSLSSVRYAGVLPAISWSGNSFTNWGARVSQIPADDIDDFAADNTFAKIAGARVEVLGDTVARDATWTVAMADAYVAVGTISIAGTHGGDGITTLTLEPGIEIRFNTALQFQIGGTSVGSPGALIADGNAAGGPAEIVFRSSSATPGPGNWAGIYFRTGARASILRNARVDHAGGSGWAAIYLNQGAGNLVTLASVTITQSGRYGVYQGGPATIGLLTVSGTADNALRVSAEAVDVDGCTLDSGSAHDVYLDNSSAVTGSIRNCGSIRSVFYAGELPAVAWTNNTFVDWGARVSRLEPEVVGSFIAGNTIQLVPGGTVEIAAGTVATDAAWTGAVGNPYIATGTIDVQGTSGPDAITTLTIAPGLELRFDPSTQFQIGGTSVGSPGALVADGNGAGGPAEIRFRSSSATPGPGGWYGLYFRAGARPSILRSARVDHAGLAGYAGIYLSQGAANPVTLDTVTVTESASYGIFQSGPAIMSQIVVSDTASNAIRFFSNSVALDGCDLDSGQDYDIHIDTISSLVGSIENCAAIHSVFYAGESPEIAWTGNTFVDWGARTSRLEPEVVGSFIADNTIQLAPGASLELTAGTVASDASWTTAAGNPYACLGTIEVQGTSGADGITTLTVAPGVELRFDTGRQLQIGGSSSSSPGALVADGDAPGGPAQILFSSGSATPAPGDWLGTYFRPGARGSLLRNARIEYGGSSGYAGIYAAGSAATSLALDSIEVADNAGHGITLAGPVSLALSGSTIEGSALDDLHVGNNGQITGSVTGCSLSSVSYAGGLPAIDWSGNSFTSWGARTSRVPAAVAGPFSTQNSFVAVPGAVLEVLGGTLVDDATWNPAVGPFRLLAGLTVQGTSGADGRTTLMLDPGATVLFPPAASLVVGGSTGNPGGLATSGAPGGPWVNFGSTEISPVAGSWTGIQVRATGRLNLADAQIRHAATGLEVRGAIDRLERVTVNRCTTGLDLQSASVTPALSGLTIRNTGTAVRSSSTSATILGSNLEGTTWGVENLSPATHCIDARGNWWGAADGPSGAAPPVGCETMQATGSGSPITAGVRFGQFVAEPTDDLDGIDCDDGDGFNDPCTAGNTVDCDDNCCAVANASQSDLDGDGVGDACDGNPVLRVSSDPLDGADFAIIQDAVDAAFQSGSTIEIFPGLGPYGEAVRLDREQVFRFVGLEEPSGDPVVVDGLAGPAFYAINKVGVAPTSFLNLTLRGAQGVRALVDTKIDGVLFDGTSLEGLRLDGGTHVVRDSYVAPPVSIGADVASGASLVLERSVVDGAADAGVVAGGSVTLLSSLVGGGSGDGVRLGPAGSAVLRYSTIAGNTGSGIDGAAGGTLDVSSSIVFGNAAGDLPLAACGAVAWSDVGSPDCSGANGNLSADPLLDVDYGLLPGSPCLDHGPDPSTFAGLPPFDLAGAPRLIDYDGDGLAIGDCGAFEAYDPSLVPGEVENVRWSLDFRMEWDAEPSAVEYHVYRDLLSNLGYASFGACADGLDATRTDTQLDDLDVPAASAAFFYLVTAEAAGGREGTLGFSTAAERSNFPGGRCP